MKVDLELEEHCVFNDSHTGEYCDAGTLRNYRGRGFGGGGLCPRCHGRGKVPTIAGFEIIEFVRHWLAHPSED